MFFGRGYILAYHQVEHNCEMGDNGYIVCKNFTNENLKSVTHICIQTLFYSHRPE